MAGSKQPTSSTFTDDFLTGIAKEMWARLGNTFVDYTQFADAMSVIEPFTYRIDAQSFFLDKKVDISNG